MMAMFKNKIKKVVFTTVISFVASLSAIAADNSGKYAAKGVGRTACSDFSSAFAEKSSKYFVYGGWIEGYISALNAARANTYDIAPWQTTELMMFLLSKHCSNNPDTRFLTAVSTMLGTFSPSSLSAESAIVEVNFNNTKSYFYADTLLQIKQQLANLGFSVSAANADFDSELASALAAFQKSKGLKQTGLPDQQTLVNLLLISKEQ